MQNPTFIIYRSGIYRGLVLVMNIILLLSGLIAAAIPAYLWVTGGWDGPWYGQLVLTGACFLVPVFFLFMTRDSVKWALAAPGHIELQPDHLVLYDHVLFHAPQHIPLESIAKLYIGPAVRWWRSSEPRSDEDTHLTLFPEAFECVLLLSHPMQLLNSRGAIPLQRFMTRPPRPKQMVRRIWFRSLELDSMRTTLGAVLTVEWAPKKTQRPPELTPKAASTLVSHLTRPWSRPPSAAADSPRRLCRP